MCTIILNTFTLSSLSDCLLLSQIITVLILFISSLLTLQCSILYLGIFKFLIIDSAIFPHVVCVVRVFLKRDFIFASDKIPKG
jgi:hypothetical protein